MQCLSRKENATRVLPEEGTLGLIYMCLEINLTNEELALDVIWEKFGEFCKPQSNEVRARFDLLTSFRQGERSMDEW